MRILGKLRELSSGTGWWQVGLTSGARYYWVLMGVASTALTARLLGPDGSGAVATAMSWTQLTATCFHLSVGQVAIHLAAAKPSRELTRLAGTLMAIVGISTLLAWLVAGPAIASGSGTIARGLPIVAVLICLGALPFMIWVQSGTSLLLSSGALNRINSFQVVASTLGVLILAVLVGPMKKGVVGALVGLMSYHVLTAMFMLMHVYRHTERFDVDWTLARQLLTGGLKLHAAVVSTFLLIQASILAVSYYRSVAEVGYYQVAVQMILALQIIPVAIGTVTYTIVTSKGADGGWNEQRKLLRDSLAVMAFVSAVAFFAAPMAVRLLGGAAFAPAVPIFRILLLSMLGMTVSGVMGSQWISRGLFAQVSVIAVTLAAIAVVGNWLVVPAFGMHGAAWVTVGIYTLAFFINAGLAVHISRRIKSTTGAPSVMSQRAVL